MINKDKKDVVKELKHLVKESDEVYLATDPDREGEAISWHLAQVLNVDMNKENRVVFNEVTKDAVVNALQHPRKIDQNLVKSQETRRVLDRIIGFKLSKLLQKKIKSKSAGRVQSVALRLIVEKLGYKAKKTMSIAQKLYEGVALEDETVGLITYMRTDSTRLSDVFVKSAYEYIEEKYGKDYVGKVKVSKKTENVQDAHEGIRPTSVLRTPESVKKFLKPDEYKLYSLIYARAMASLMAPAKFDATSVSLMNNGYEFKVTGSVMKFDGYLRVYGAYEKQNNELLPELKEKEMLESKKVEKTQHFTKPPARYSEAKLIKEMEELGIGRPSTYAMIIDTIQTRGYVELVDKAFKPTETGILTSDRLTQYFNDIINVEYTAKMEHELDEIAEGEDDYVSALQSFMDVFQPLLDDAYDKMEVVAPKKTGEKCPACGHDLVERRGRYGLFVACENYPECKYIKKDPVELEYTGEECPKCGGKMVFKNGRFGRFEACSNYPECKYIKNSKKKEPVMTDEVCPNCGSPVVIKQGRYGEFKACSNYPKCKTIIK